MTATQTNKGTVAFQAWVACLFVASILGAMAYWTGDEVVAIFKAEAEAIGTIFGDWPVGTATQWWNCLRLDQMEDATVQWILKGTREGDPLSALASQINRFSANCVINAFGFIFIGFVRFAMSLQWMLFCTPLFVISASVGMLQREVNRQTFAFSSPYRLAAKVRFLKWTLVSWMALLVVPLEISPYLPLAAVWLLAISPGFLLAGLQKEI